MMRWAALPQRMPGDDARTRHHTEVVIFNGAQTIPVYPHAGLKGGCERGGIVEFVIPPWEYVGVVSLPSPEAVASIVRYYRAAASFSAIELPLSFDHLSGFGTRDAPPEDKSMLRR